MQIFSSPAGAALSYLFKTTLRRSDGVSSKEHCVYVHCASLLVYKDTVVPVFETRRFD